jgi:hypothetical protein
MEKKIQYGGSKLPRQIVQLERKLTATFVNTFTAARVDVLEIEADEAISRVWSDTEKCIFLDRFMQHPKDFRRIASFLRNKTTRDCVRYYYDSKQSIPFKAALREHIMRRKGKGDYRVWDATIEAAISVGAVVLAGTSQEKPLVFLLPENDHTFHTRGFHPLKIEMFDSMNVDMNVLRAVADEESDDDEPPARGPGRPRKRPREPLFLVDQEQRKFLKTLPSKIHQSQSKTSLLDEDSEPDQLNEKVSTPLRRAPQKWTDAEKRIFVETLELQGRNWEVLSQAVGTKSISQIKNFYYDYKKQSGKPSRADKDTRSANRGSDLYRREDSLSPVSEVAFKPEPDRASTPTESFDNALQPGFLPGAGGQLLEQPMARLHEQGDIARHLHSLQASTNGQDELSAADRWVQLQRQSLLTQQHQQQQQQQQSSQLEEATRRMLQQQPQQHQHLLSSLMPWSNVPPPAQSWSDAHQLSSVEQQLQRLLELQRQQQQQPSQPHNSLSALSNASQQLRTQHLGGLGGVGGVNNPSALELALAQQQRSENAQLLQLLGLQQGADNPAETLAMIRRAMGGGGGNNGSFQGDR